MGTAARLYDDDNKTYICNAYNDSNHTESEATAFAIGGQHRQSIRMHGQCENVRFRTATVSISREEVTPLRVVSSEISGGKFPEIYSNLSNISGNLLITCQSAVSKSKIAKWCSKRACF